MLKRKPICISAFLILMTLLIALAGLPGCIGSDLHRCSWGTYCPAGTLCDDLRERCVAPGQVDACDGVDDSDVCTYPGAPDGVFYCRGGLCVLAQCGDNVRGTSEACDDGNTDSGDGCSANCLSLEICGNRYVDSQRGEGCDDGNQENHDGCTSSCIQEFPTWEEVWATLPGLFGMTVATDLHNERVVVHGGVYPDGVFLDAAWSFDGSSWARIHSELQPPARMDAAMAYDASGQRVVLHAGWSGYASLSDTWELDGETWREVVTAHAPPARSGLSMAYDPLRGRVVLFGGEFADRTTLNTTWEYDGTDWQEILVADPPPARRYHSMAYDPLRQRVILFGGSYDNPDWQYLDDTWEYDGQAWTQLATVTSPSPRNNHMLVWDPDHQRMVMFGGRGPTGLLSDTWVLDGLQWVQLETGLGPGPRVQFALAHDPTTARLVLVGGTTGAYQAWDGMWQLQGEVWSRLHSRIPPERLGAGMVYDEARGRIVMYGGADGFPDGAAIDDTWEYDGYTWSRILPTTTPGARAGHSMIYDSQRQRTLVFGGVRSSSFTDCADDLWEYDGLDWTLITPPASSPIPPARAVASHAYDPRRGVTVIFGGMCSWQAMDDMWEYNGVSWQQVLPPDQPSIPTPDATPTWPSARAGAAMAWDPVRHSIVLYGGQTDDAENLNDTWEYTNASHGDGDSDADGVWRWRLMTPPSAPPPRAGHALLFNAARDALTVIGGIGETTNLDIWELQGDTWSIVTVTSPPEDRSAAAAAYFPPHDAIFMHGGVDGLGHVRDEWLRYRFEGASPDEICHGEIDEDGDSLIDCNDPDCEGRPCGFMKICLAGTCF